MELTPNEISRFWARVQKAGAYECWLWTGNTHTVNTKYTPMIYGQWSISRHGKSINRNAHRFAWIIANGRMPADGNVIRHSCDTPLCCNPAHLLDGTRADNQRDMQDRLRSGILGEKNPKAKFTEAQVIELRASPESDKVLARRFGVWESTMHALRTGKKWRYLPGAQKRTRTRKLTPDQVRDLRRRHGAGETTNELAKVFGISQGYVSQVALGQCYRSVG